MQIQTPKHVKHQQPLSHAKLVFGRMEIAAPRADNFAYNVVVHQIVFPVKMDIKLLSVSEATVLAVHQGVKLALLPYVRNVFTISNYQMVIV